MDTPTRIPTQLIIEIGGFGAPHHEVRWHRGKLRYRTDDSKGTVAPSAEAWETFWATMDKIGVWDWKSRYDDPETMDGVQWKVEINDGVRRVQSFGSNRYPGSRDREKARPFQEFLKAVGALIQQPFG